MKYTRLFLSVAFATAQSIAYSQSTDTLDTKLIENIIGIKGKANKGEFKITIPQNDLSVWVDSFKIIPPMGTSTWVAFTPTAKGTMLMGDLVLTETDIKPVQQELIKQGLTTSAIHNHFIRNHPNIVFMHAGGMGTTADMAKKIKAVLDKINESRSHYPAASPADSVKNTLDIKLLDGILGYTGEMQKGVYKYTIGRPDVILKEGGTTITTFMGFNTWAAWQGTQENAAVCGDFAMLEDEVEPVLKALISSGIEVVALHTHMVHEKPRIYFLHYWGTGKAAELAKGLKTALNETGKMHGDGMKM